MVYETEGKAGLDEMVFWIPKLAFFYMVFFKRFNCGFERSLLETVE